MNTSELVLTSGGVDPELPLPEDARSFQDLVPKPNRQDVPVLAPALPGASSVTQGEVLPGIFADTQIGQADLVQSVRFSPEGRTESMINQLRSEAVVNRPANPDYADQLDALADDIESGVRVLPDGSYRRLPIENARLVPDPDNPIENALPIAILSDSEAEIAAEIGQLQARIDASEDQFFGNPLSPLDHIGAAGRAAQRGTWEIEKTYLINSFRLQPSRDENANTYQALGDGADPEATPVIFINGINTDTTRSSLQALELSETFGTPINHVVNASDVISGGFAGTGILIEDIQDPNAGQLRTQQHRLGNRPAAAEAANLILDQLFDPALAEQDAPVRVIGYSQGSAIGSQALRDVDSYLSLAVESDSIDAETKTQMLERIQFLGVGPSVDERHLDQNYTADGTVEPIPDLSDVNYRVILDANDPIPQVFNVGKDGLDPVQSAEAAGRVAQGDLLQHLSYFSQYENTDPGSTFNVEAREEMQLWFRGEALDGIVKLDP